MGKTLLLMDICLLKKKELQKELKNFEIKSQKNNQTQIFIETPYRNSRLFEEYLKVLNPNTELCLAVDLTLKTEFIFKTSIYNWKKKNKSQKKTHCFYNS